MLSNETTRRQVAGKLGRASSVQFDLYTSRNGDPWRESDKRAISRKAT